MSEEREKEKLEIANQSENEVRNLLKQFFAKDQNLLLKFVWNFDMAKKTMRDMSLDVAKLPLGCLKIERIKKSLQILNKIQKQL